MNRKNGTGQTASSPASFEQLLSSLDALLGGESVLTQARTRIIEDRSTGTAAKSIDEPCAQCHTRLQGQSVIRLIDGRFLCPDCARRKPSDGKGYFSLAKEIRSLFERVFSVQLPAPVSVHFKTDRFSAMADETLCSIYLLPGGDPLGAAGKQDDVYNIWISADLPYAECVDGLAAAFCILWLMDRFPKDTLEQEASALAIKDGAMLALAFRYGLQLYCVVTILMACDLEAYATGLLKTLQALRSTDCINDLQALAFFRQSCPIVFDAQGALPASPFGRDWKEQLAALKNVLHFE